MQRLLETKHQMPSHAEINHLAWLKTTLRLCAFLVVCLGPGIARHVFLFRLPPR
jgi:hypothetical protein